MQMLCFISQGIHSYQKEQIYMFYHLDLMNINHCVWPKPNFNRPQNVTKVLGGLPTRRQAAPKAFAFRRSF